MTDDRRENRVEVCGTAWFSFVVPAGHIMLDNQVITTEVLGTSLSCRTAVMRLYEILGFARVPGYEVTNRTSGTSVSMVHIL